METGSACNATATGCRACRRTTRSRPSTTTATCWRALPRRCPPASARRCWPSCAICCAVAGAGRRPFSHALSLRARAQGRRHHGHTQPDAGCRAAAHHPRRQRPGGPHRAAAGHRHGVVRGRKPWACWWTGRAKPRPAAASCFWPAKRRRRPARSMLQAEQQARALEELNALYVALTRAEPRLVISSFEPHQRGAPQLVRAPASLATACTPQRGGRPPAAETCLSWPCCLRWPCSAPSARTRGPAVGACAETDDEPRRFGLAVHRLLQWRPTRSSPSPGARRTGARSRRSSRWWPTAPQAARAMAERMVRGEAAWVWDPGGWTIGATRWRWFIRARCCGSTAWCARAHGRRACHLVGARLQDRRQPERPAAAGADAPATAPRWPRPTPAHRCAWPSSTQRVG